jgi:hypothetical protein
MIELQLEEQYETLRSKLLAFEAPLVALEVRRSSHYVEQREVETLIVTIALARPGPDDSRYRLQELTRIELPAPYDGRPWMQMAGRIANEFHIALHPDSAEPLPRDGLRWLPLQGDPPVVTWTCEWETVVWTQDGKQVHRAGDGQCTGCSGKKALEDGLRRYTTHSDTPSMHRIRIVESETTSNAHWGGTYPSLAVPMDVVRDWALAGQPPSMIVMTLRQQEPRLSILDCMVVLEQAFCIGLKRLASVSDFLAGTLSDDQLDAELAEPWQSTRAQWSLPAALRKAHAHGHSIGPVLHASYAVLGSSLLLAQGLRQAFGLSLRDVKNLVDTACSGQRDAQLDAELAAAIAKTT